MPGKDVLGAGGELRQHKRQPQNHSLLVCYPRQDGCHGSEKHACSTRDVSEGGLKIITRRSLPLGCIMPIEVHVSGSKSCFKFIGEVKWCLEIDQTPNYFAGIKLLEIVENGYKMWHQLVRGIKANEC